MSQETDGIIAYLRSTGVAGMPTEINKPKAHGPTSFHYAAATKGPVRRFEMCIDHSSGDQSVAVDWGFRRGQRDSAELLAIFNAFWAARSKLKELIYAGPGVTHWISNGKVYPRSQMPKAVADMHHDHVHVAVAKGVVLKQWVDDINELRAAQAQQQTTGGDNDMADFTVGACMAPSGKGRWVLDRDGAVRTYSFDPNNPVMFHGSMYDYPEEQKVKDRYYIGIQPVVIQDANGNLSSKDEYGYWIFSNDGGAFKLVKRA